MQIDDGFMNRLQAIAAVSQPFRADAGDARVVMGGTNNPSVLIDVTFEETFPVNVTLYNLSNFIRFIKSMNGVAIEWEPTRAVVRGARGAYGVFNYCRPEALPTPPKKPSPEGFRVLAKTDVDGESMAALSGSFFNSFIVAADVAEGVTCGAVLLNDNDDSFTDSYFERPSGEAHESVTVLFRDFMRNLSSVKSDYQFELVSPNKHPSTRLLHLTRDDGVEYYVAFDRIMDTWPTTQSGLLNMHRK